MFKVSRDIREEFREFLMKNENINSVFKVNNGFDFLVEAIFRDMNDMQRFNELLERFNIEAKQRCLYLKILREKDFIRQDSRRVIICRTLKNKKMRK